MDSNNFLDSVGVGEREARVASELVARRHYRLAHGIGRSGDVSAEQPKAAGSSLLVKLVNLLAENALGLAGLQDVGTALVLPLATGMAMTTTLLALRSLVPPSARYVLWPRVDQKTCLKSITAAGYEVVVIPMRQVAGADELTTDVDAIRRHLGELGAEQVACVITTTSCFAPRSADDVLAVAKLCQEAGVPHMVNNAYGVQARALCTQLTSAWRKGRVDCVVQSTDKNFMVPVGGAILAARAGRTELVERVNSLYPGRASVAPLLDLLITLLHWGASGWQQVLQQREELYSYALQRLQARRNDGGPQLHAAFAEEVGERVLHTPGNPISLALTLSTLSAAPPPSPHSQLHRPHSGGMVSSPRWGQPVRLAGSPGPAPSLWEVREGSPSPQGKAGELAASGHGSGGGPSSRTPAGAMSMGRDQDGGAGGLRSHQATALADARTRQTGKQALAAGSEEAAATAAGASMDDEDELPMPSPRPAGSPAGAPGVTMLGSMLFRRCVSGTRVVARGKRQSVGGKEFVGYGAHCDDYPCDYLTVAAAVGTSRRDIDEFVARARLCFGEFKRKQAREQQRQQPQKQQD
ncbi:hypothetical protein N2152v2_007683 [Parachlorella kessleri]